MAVDEVLLGSTAETGQPALRLYGWSAPTLSLGYFQAYADRCGHAASADCAVVRRLTGGGAILHDCELTYSLCWIGNGQGRPDVQWLYDAVHAAVRAELAQLDLPADRSAEDSDKAPFLCFQRRSKHDVVVRGAKIVGSAQRRKKSAVLQHGSILLATSLFAPELPGLNDLSGGDLSGGDLSGKVYYHNSLRQTLPPRLSRQLHMELHASQLTEREVGKAGKLVDEKYGSDRWSRRR